MAPFESLLALASSSMCSQQYLMYWGVYPRYISREMLNGGSYYPEYADTLYRAGGFAARDRALAASYLSSLLKILRSDNPDHYRQAWTHIAEAADGTGVLGRHLAPRYNGLCWETARSEWTGAPATLYTNTACIRMARAAIAVMLKGRDENGLFKKPDFMEELLRDMHCPMTGAPIVCKVHPHRCSLTYSVRIGPRRDRDYWEVGVQIDTPQTAAK